MDDALEFVRRVASELGGPSLRQPAWLYPVVNDPVLSVLLKMERRRCEPGDVWQTASGGWLVDDAEVGENRAARPAIDLMKARRFGGFDALCSDIVRVFKETAGEGADPKEWCVVIPHQLWITEQIDRKPGQSDMIMGTLHAIFRLEKLAKIEVVEPACVAEVKHDAQ